MTRAQQSVRTDGGVSIAEPGASRPPMRAADFDYVVVGAGSAGCVLASRLSEDPECSVLLLEAGPMDDRSEIHDPLQWPALLGSEVDWGYATTPQPGTGGRVHAWPRGKVVGGSGCMNGMVYMRGSSWDYDEWAMHGNPGWDFGAVTDAYRRMEAFSGGDPAFRGTDGPLRITVVDDVNPLTTAFLEACAQRGHRESTDFNGSHAEGYGLHQLNAADERRQSSAVAFLHPALSRRNLTLVTGATVQRLTHSGDEDRRVEEIVYVRDGDEHHVRATGEVILAAGAIDSPKLLMLSGIGPADELRRVGVEVQANLPGVGQNLHDHLAITATYEARQEVPVGRNQNSEGALFCRSAPDLPRHDVQFAFLHIPYLAPGFTCGPHGYTLFGGVLKPLSRGRIMLRSAEPADVPLIDPAYLREEADYQRLRQTLEIARDIGAASAFDQWRSRAVAPADDVRSPAAIRSYIAAAATTFYHPVGTCKMGGQSDCVVDPALRVHGFRNLRVADASIVPEIMSGNTNAAAMMIGWRAADFIRSGARTDRDLAASSSPAPDTSA